MFGNTLRRLRKSAGLTQVDLAQKAGVSAATVVRLEGGQNTPDLATLVKLAGPLGVTVADLLGGHSDQSAA